MQSIAAASAYAPKSACLRPGTLGGQLDLRSSHSQLLAVLLLDKHSPYHNFSLEKWQTQPNSSTISWDRLPVSPEYSVRRKPRTATTYSLKLYRAYYEQCFKQSHPHPHLPFICPR